VNYQWITTVGCGKPPLICGYNVEKKQLKIIGKSSCGTLAEGVEILLPPETGTIWGKLQKVRRTGKLGFRTGAWPWRAALSANWPGDWLPWCGGADEASSISYMEEASFIC
jgi:hypothetical protein